MSGLKKTLGLVAIVADIALLTTGCVSGVVDIDSDINHSGNVEVSAQFHRTFDLDEQVSIQVVGANGSIRGGDETLGKAVR